MSESKRRRSENRELRWSESQDTTFTEESEAEDYLQPDELVNCICGYYEENGLMIQVLDLAENWIELLRLMFRS